jgi:hypothetical protein
MSMTDSEIEALVAAIPGEQQRVVREHLPAILDMISAGECVRAVQCARLMYWLVADEGGGRAAPEFMELMAEITERFPGFRAATRIYWGGMTKW